MELSLSHSIEKNHCILCVEGSLALESVTETRDYLRPILDKPVLKGLLIDFSKLRFIDSSGIGLIVTLFKSMQQEKRRFAIAGLNERNREIFAMTRLDKILSIHPSVEEALKLFT